MKNFIKIIILLTLLISIEKVNSETKEKNNSFGFGVSYLFGEPDYTITKKSPYTSNLTINQNWSYVYNDLIFSKATSLMIINIQYRRKIKVVGLSLLAGITTPGNNEEYVDTTHESFLHRRTTFTISHLKIPFLFEASSNFPKIIFFKPFVAGFIGFDITIIKMKEMKSYYDEDIITINEKFNKKTLTAGGKAGLEFIIPNNRVSFAANFIYRYSKIELQDVLTKNGYTYDCKIRYPGLGMALDMFLHF